MKLKKLAMAVALSLSVQNAAFSMAVFDSANFAQALLEFQQLQREYDQAIDRYNTLKAQYDAMVVMKDSLKHGVSLDSLYDVTNYYTNFLGKLSSYSEEYFKDVTSISPKALSFAKQFMELDGHKEDLSDVPESMREATRNIYYYEGKEMEDMKLYEEAMKAYRDSLEKSAKALKEAPDMKASQDILNKMEFDKRSYEYSKELLKDSVELMEKLRKANVRKIETAQKKFFYTDED